jgi:hypothetical protein
VKTLPLEAGQIAGSAQAEIKRIDQISLRFYKTYSARVGENDLKLDNLTFRGTETFDSPVLAFTGAKTYKFDGTQDRDVRIIIESDEPTPHTLLGITARGVGYNA